MSGEYLLPLAMLAAMLGGILIGYPVALVLGGSAAVFLLSSDLPASFVNLMASRIYANALGNWLLVCIPMFVFMGLVLERTGTAVRALTTLQTAMGRMPGGLAIAVLIVGTLLAAASGIVGASVVLLGTLAVPQMRAAGYSRPLSAGIVCGAGTLAILIPPSIMLVLFSDLLNVSVGDLFAGALVPGLILAGSYAVLIAVWALLDPRAAPRSALGGVSAVAMLRDTLPLALLIFCVLGSILLGYATPTEASALGAVGSLVIAAFTRTLTPRLLYETTLQTAYTTAMVMLVTVGATCFSAVFRGVGGEDMILDGLKFLQLGAWGTLMLLMAVIFVLGCFLDWLEISLITLPIFGAVIGNLDFGFGLSQQQTLLWFAVLVAINLQTSFLSPPFGFSLFYLRAVTRDVLSNRDIYLGIVPFIAMQLVVLGLFMIFPGLIVWPVK
ncbi:TRAP transporter large permease [Arenibaculum pallidiluteum]|uniref:TRAP transporter large permease n=1 Tax=Arenibaculum pallidiluteum TaxID=2812559 RepID=UPI001A970DF1|nr:TRAP transporter large permease subunit [Arenibaculum pallidiluteum]